MKLCFISVEQKYDPGFTVIASVSEGTASYYVRTGGVISKSVDVPDHRASEILREAAILRFDALQKFMNDVAQGEQIRRGWREAPKGASGAQRNSLLTTGKEGGE